MIGFCNGGKPSQLSAAAALPERAKQKPFPACAEKGLFASDLPDYFSGALKVMVVAVDSASSFSREMGATSMDRVSNLPS